MTFFLEKVKVGRYYKVRAWGGSDGEVNRVEQMTFRAVKLFCRMLQQWTHDGHVPGRTHKLYNTKYIKLHNTICKTALLQKAKSNFSKIAVHLIKI